MNAWRAYSSKGEQQAAFCRAADYADEWFGSFNQKLRVYYVCRAGAAEWPCDTLILSKEWHRMHKDPMASKQRWYCEECDAKYKTKYGVVCELLMGDGNLRYCAAPIPCQVHVGAKHAGPSPNARGTLRQHPHRHAAGHLHHQRNKQVGPLQV